MGRLAQLAGAAALTALTASISQISLAADDLYDVLALALENDPTLRQAEANYRANRENMIQSRAGLLQTSMPRAIPHARRLVPPMRFAGLTSLLGSSKSRRRTALNRA
jgi:hypothetical protein